MQSRRLILVVGLAVLWLSALGAHPCALAQDYHPLAIGSHWQYYSTAYGDHSMTIIGERVVLGATTRIRRQVESDQAYENFWSKDSSGNLFLHGARNLTYPFAVAYLPPIRMVAPPLSLGKVWVTTGVHTYDLDGTPWGNNGTGFPLRVYTEGVVTVPAGNFYAYGIGYDSGFMLTLVRPEGTFDLFGKRVAIGDLGAENTTDWYSAEVGLVQFTNDEDKQRAFKLVSYTLPSVSTQATTWGQLKASLGRPEGAR